MRLRDSDSACVVQISLEQARMLAVEMRGLATDHCPLHHLAMRVVDGLHARIDHIVIQQTEDDEDVTTLVALTTDTGRLAIPVDTAAGLSLAIHVGLPIFMEGEFPAVDPEWRARSESSVDKRAGPKVIAESSLDSPGNPGRLSTPIPLAFQEFIDGLEKANENDRPENRPAGDEGR